MDQKKYRILLVEFHQESNTFNPIVASFSSFHPQSVFEGAQRYAEKLGERGMVAGSVDAIEQLGGEVIPTVFMHAPSGGRVDDNVLLHICERLTDYVRASTFDGVVADLHGATSCVSYDDACGYLLRHLRKLVGDKPIAAGFDLHANITDTVLENVDFICGYNTYPHVDQYTTGYRAAQLLMERLQKGKCCVMAAAGIKMLIPPSGFNSLEGPFRDLMEQGKTMVAQRRIRDFTLFPVQPWLDICDITSRVVTIGEDAAEALRCADELAAGLYAMRADAMPQLHSVDAIIDAAEANTGKPVIMAYAADSPNGGCVGDSPVVALRIWERQSQLHTLMCIVDPDAAAYAHKLGVGASAEFSIGAGFTKGMPGPFRAEGKVRSLHDGTLRTSKLAKGYVGPSAVISFGNMDILVCTRGSMSGSPVLFRGMGLEPSHYDLVVVKANTSFRAPYAPISDRVYVVDAPGAGSPNLLSMPWEVIDRDQYPFTDGILPQKAQLY